MENATERADASHAAPLLAHALSFEESLRSRTEGLTWMIWGFVLALILLMYAAMGDIGEAAPLWTYALWVPWVLGGSLATWALWRTAALSIRGHEKGPAGMVVTLAWLLAIAASLSIYELASLMPNPESSSLVALGIAWLVAGATNLFRASGGGRRVLIAIGTTLTMIGFGFAFLLPAPHGSDLARFGQEVLRAAILAGVPLVAGLWQALRG